jgi:hypothetical protein
MTCQHEYVEDRWYWDAGRLWQVLRCRLCGHESEAWTRPKEVSNNAQYR